MEEKNLPQGGIDTRIVRGFLDAGKTSYIEDSITHDYFHKYGATLVISFEEGEKSYDQALLSAYRTEVVFVSEEEDEGEAISALLEEKRPDRVYIEMNCMREGEDFVLPEALRVTFQLAIFDWKTCPLYITNMTQLIMDIVRVSDQVIFRDCPSKEELRPYSRFFRTINQRAQYLRKDPMGYHEKAFDLFVPYSLEAEVLDISEKDYLWLWLDSRDHPEHYEGKELVFTDPLYVRVIPDSSGSFEVGRIVMTCCIADVQFMGFPVKGEADRGSEGPDTGSGGERLRKGCWMIGRARGVVYEDSYRQKYLALEDLSAEIVRMPKEIILSAV